MSEIDTQHPHVLDQIEAYLGGGLSPDEMLALEAHVAECAECSQVLAEARETDDEMRNLFEETRLGKGFEEKIIRRLRASRGPRRRILHPMVLRSAAAIAAAAMVAGTGVVVTNVLNGNGSPFGWLLDGSGWIRTASNLKQIGSAYSMDSSRAPMAPPPRHYLDSNSVEATAGTVAAGAAVPSESNSYRSGTTLASGTLPFGGVAGAASVNSFGRSNANGGFTKSGSGTLTLTNGPATAAPVDVWDTTQSPAFTQTKAPQFSNNSGDTYAFRPTQLGSAGSIRGLLVAHNPANIVEPAITVNATKGTVSVADGGTLLLGGQVVAGVVNRDGDGVKDVDGTAKTASNPAPAVTNPPAQQGGPVDSRKVIRNGTMDFDVDRFDDALVRITRLVGEQQGYVATTDSDKQSNGKVRGTLTLRVPADRLDTLVLTLRGIGDIRGQKLTAEDVTKHYTDLESELRADRAMEERLLEIIKTGKGEIKDLLAAEKELGVWRGKIEAMEGERRYIENQVTLSTLVVTLYEKENKVPTSASESEQVNMSLETQKVDDDYGKALEAINTAKGRIIQSELKQYDAGQFGATIVAAVPPDAAEQVIARLRQLDGRVAHFSREHKQTIQNTGTVPLTMLKVDRQDAVVSLQIYNLANIAPRHTTGMKLAVAEVDKTFEKLTDLVRSAGGRIVTSSLQRPDANTQSAELDLQVPVEKADTVVDALHGFGEVMRQESAENPDTANVTESKRGFRISLVSMATTQARENQTLQLAAANVPGAFNDILNAIRAGDGRVLQSDLNEQNPQDVVGTIVFEMPRTAAVPVNTAIDKAAQVLTRVVNRSSNTDNTVDTKLRLQMTLMSAERLAPRQTTTIREEVADVEHAVDDLANAAVTAGGRRLGNGDLTQDRAGHVTAQVVVEVPMSKAGPILDQLERMGNRRGKQVAFDTSVPEGPLARARIDATFSNSAASLGGEETTWDAIRDGLSTSGKGLRWSVQMLVIGFCFVAPWGVMLWVIGKLIRRSRNRVVKAPVSPTV
jgi:hypothetical protein